MKVLFNIPDLRLSGGVSNHYKGLSPYWNCDFVYNVVGKRKNLPGWLVLPIDYLKFFYLCLFRDIELVVLNPSLGKTALLRDSYFLKIAKSCRIKTVVFIHGWDPEVEKYISNRPYYFTKNFDKADGFLVLGKHFKDILIKWGIKSKISLTTTKVDNRLLENFSLSSERSSVNNILFLARIEEAKGIYTAINAFNLAFQINKDLTFTVAGDGSALSKAKEYCKSNKIQNVKFLGNINGQELIETFKNSDIYILPTTHGEGMPTSLLEAMAFGLPVIARPNGGLIDFFENGKMGWLINSTDPDDFSHKILELVSNMSLYNQIKQFNYRYAKKHFMASIVSSNLESELRKF